MSELVAATVPPLCPLILLRIASPELQTAAGAAPPPAHFPSDPAFVPRGLVVGAVAFLALVLG